MLTILALLCITLLPGYHSLHAQDDSTILYPGTYQAEDARINTDAKIVEAEGADGGQAVDTTYLGFDHQGSDFIVKWQGESPIIDGDCGIILPRNTPVTADGWRYSHFSSLIAVLSGKDYFHMHTLSNANKIGSENPCLWLGSRSDETIRIDSITIIDRTFERSFPFIAAVGITLGMTLFVVITALRERWRQK